MVSHGKGERHRVLTGYRCIVCKKTYPYFGEAMDHVLEIHADALKGTSHAAELLTKADI